MFMHNHKLYQATVAHFNQRGHNITDMQVLILKKKTCFRWGLKKGERKMCMRNRKLDPATGAHFNQRGNNIADMQVLSLKKNMLQMGPTERRENKCLLITSTPTTRGSAIFIFHLIQSML